ncbi:class I SAM-dependent methyltransferase [Dactylosporangium sp. NBC_01737]|uniref:class I SAM-dependent DNA methyltransferase n=1 Tax=Dactylosporangium sp. NBC_01737 TaxID=2975959 RepID=UPI002E12D681|nr:class I SAM-dependent methyltransferase [Dactylosporangium sp. NBC_01737]
MANDQDLASAYELIYTVAAGKDYQREAYDITDLIRRRNPTADSLLDVACGTGLHLSHFRHSFAHVEGLEIAEPMRRAAIDRLDGVPVHAGDMRHFRLPRTFSAVTCLFSSIGYARSVEELNQTLDCLAAHLDPGGVLLLEPWFTPTQWIAGPVDTGTATDGRRHLTRMCVSRSAGTTSTLTMHYLLGETGTGIRHWTEEHSLTLFTNEQYRDAIHQARLRDVEWLPGWGDRRPRISAVKRRPTRFARRPSSAPSTTMPADTTATQD